MKKVTLRYSEELIKETVRIFWLRQIWPVCLIVTSALLFFVYYLVIANDRSWVVGFMGAFACMGIIATYMSYSVLLKRAMHRLKRMGRPEATLELNDDCFKVTSDVGATEFKWQFISKVMRFKNAWIICLGENETMTLPIADMPEESKDLIIEKVTAYKGKIV